MGLAISDLISDMVPVFLDDLLVCFRQSVEIDQVGKFDPCVDQEVFFGMPTTDQHQKPVLSHETTGLEDLGYYLVVLDVTK